MSQEMVVSPLTEAGPASIDELFSRDPLNLKDADVDAIIEHFRRERSKWETKEAAAKARKETKKEIAGKAPLALADLDL